MSIEDDLRAALAAEADRTDPVDDWDEIQAGVGAGQRRRRFLTAGIGGLAAAAVVALVMVAVPVLDGDDATLVDSGVAQPGGGDSAETEEPSEVVPEEPDELEPEPEEQPNDGREIFGRIWPFSTTEAEEGYPQTVDDAGFHGNESVDYTDATATALDFARTYLGFPQPVEADPDALGQGPMSSGQDPIVILVAPKAGSPLTTAITFGRLEGSEAWSVVDVRSPNILLDEHLQQDDVRSSVRVAGSSTAFEGTIQIEVRDSGMRHGQSLGTGFATGGSMGDHGPFEAEVSFGPPTGSSGAIVLTTVSMEDGSVQEATVLPVRFGAAGAGPAIPPPNAEQCIVPDLEPANDQMAVTVFFTCDTGDPATNPGPVTSVNRVVPPSPGLLRASLEALLAGPTDAERDAGLGSSFSTDSAGMLRGVSIDGDGAAVVDLGPDLPLVMANASTSAGSAALLAELNATVFQFPNIETVEYRLAGSCEDFYGWLQRGCDIRSRTD